MTGPADLAAARVAKAERNGNGGAATDDNRWPAPTAPMKVARRIANDRHQQDGTLTLRRWRSQWVNWDGTGAWADVEDAAIRESVYDLLEDATYWHPKEGELPWAPTRAKIANALEALDAVTHLAGDIDVPAWLDDADGPPAGEIVACRNGLLHVTTRDLLPHDPRFLTRTAVPYDYQHDAPEPLGWMRFLHDLWPDDEEAIAALQEWFGYVLSGRTALHKILLLVGPPRSGKGTIARVLAALLGPANVANPTMASLTQNFGLQNLIARPLAIIPDARVGGRDASVVVERLLLISGEDRVTIDRKYRDPWDGRLPTRFTVLSNELPNFGDASGAIATRFVILTMTRTFLGKENLDLTDELLGELPGILLWALDGLERVTRQGRLTEPRSSVDSVLALQDSASPISAFLRDHCDKGDYEVEVASLYAAWKDWSESNGSPAGSRQAFGRDLRAVVPGLKERQPRIGGVQVRHYVGLRLKDRD